HAAGEGARRTQERRADRCPGEDLAEGRLGGLRVVLVAGERDANDAGAAGDAVDDLPLDEALLRWRAGADGHREGGARDDRTSDLYEIGTHRITADDPRAVRAAHVSARLDREGARRLFVEREAVGRRAPYRHLKAPVRTDEERRGRGPALRLRELAEDVDVEAVAPALAERILRKEDA